MSSAMVNLPEPTGGRTKRPGDRAALHVKHQHVGLSLLFQSWHKWPSVLMFFWYLYHSVAEGLPEAVIKMESIMDRRTRESDSDSAI
jgi:hypothetical protein